MAAFGTVMPVHADRCRKRIPNFGQTRLRAIANTMKMLQKDSRRLASRALGFGDAKYAKWNHLYGRLRENTARADPDRRPSAENNQYQSRGRQSSPFIGFHSVRQFAIRYCGNPVEENLTRSMRITSLTKDFGEHCARLPNCFRLEHLIHCRLRATRDRRNRVCRNGS